jgi:demethylmenaquinone methyltransferase / 2-methoxy-6-polyprenyl-1,4-benzoquinol methylase
VTERPSPARAAEGAGSVPDRRFVGELFEWLAPRYDAALRLYSLGQDLRWKSELLRGLRSRTGDRALDLACGTAGIYDRLSRRLGPERVVGLDVNVEMMRAAPPTSPRRQLVRGDAVRLPFEDRSFDLVTAGYLFKYVRREELAAELRRVLRPGGRFAGYDFSAPRPGTMASRWYALFLLKVLPWLGRRRDRGGARWAGLLEFLGRIATGSRWEDEIERTLRSAGFEGIDLRPDLGGAITWVWATAPKTR